MQQRHNPTKFDWPTVENAKSHYTDVTMSSMASQITSLGIFYSTVYSGEDQRKYQSSASLAFVRRIHRGPVNSPHKRPVTRKIFPFDDVIMIGQNGHTPNDIGIYSSCWLEGGENLHYLQTSNISRTKLQQLNVSHLVLQLSLPKSIKAWF